MGFGGAVIFRPVEVEKLAAMLVGGGGEIFLELARDDVLKHCRLPRKVLTRCAYEVVWREA
jgi:hypothetical protein